MLGDTSPAVAGGDAAQSSLAHGDKLTATSWADFVKRLHHDCVGEGVRGHYTAEALFTVQARRIVSGIDREYAQSTLVACGERQWFSPKEYWDGLDDGEKAALDAEARATCDDDFLKLPEWQQWDFLESLPDHIVTGWDERWEYVNSHFTKDAAEAFIARKKHDYRDGIRVYVEAQIYCWEFNTIKAAILDGRLTFQGA